jgi:ABC-type polar amino acid transport system ATPase subunit
MSGGGKSTLVNLIPAFYSPTGGKLLLDGQSVDEISRASLRAQIAMVSQNVVLFDDTIAANIAYGDKHADRGRIEAAARAAYLADTIAALPDGFETRIGDNGSRLSGGQRQRLAIARAIYKDAPLLILDEATSALDTESERSVQAALDELMVGRTTFVIAHRLSSAPTVSLCCPADASSRSALTTDYCASKACTRTCITFNFRTCRLTGLWPNASDHVGVTAVFVGRNALPKNKIHICICIHVESTKSSSLFCGLATAIPGSVSHCGAFRARCASGSRLVQARD